MKKIIFAALTIGVVMFYGVANYEGEEVQHIVDLAGQAELMFAVVISAAIAMITYLINYFSSGKGLTFIISFVAGKIYFLMNSDDEKGKAQFMETVDTILNQSIVQDIMKKLDKSIAEKLAILMHDLVDIKMKLKHTDDPELTKELLDAKKQLEDAIDEVST